MKRRTFTALASLFTVNLALPLACSPAKKESKLRILVLGGTNFVGPALVNAALAKGHEVTLFNRGITNPGLFPDLPLIKGDRLLGVSAYKPLLEEDWDVVIDVWPEKSKLVKEATTALAENAGHYVFISSIAVYADFQEVGLHENSDVVSLDGDPTEWYYSEEKLASENAVRTRFPYNHTILRPGAIKGWRDPALDLFYWCHKLNRDEAIIAPGSGEDPIQFIDVKDVGSFSITAVEKGLSGTFNCVGPLYEPLPWNDFLNSAKKHFNSTTELVWASEEFLAEKEVRSFSDLPLWAPLSEDRGFMQISNAKMKDTGFQLTPMEKTLDDCVDWHMDTIEKYIEFGSSDVGLGLNRSRELTLVDELKTTG